MSTLLPFLALDQNCEQVQAWVRGELIRAGFRIVQTFDLHIARLAHTDCPCPHHGTDECDCQMVVLLVYRKRDDPATLIIHGQDGKAWLSLAGPVGQRTNQYLEAAIRHALMPHPSDILAPSEVSYEA